MKLSEEFNLIFEFMAHIPVNVELLAKSLGIGCIPFNFDKTTSGMLECVSENKYCISYNQNHPFTRQRFTIAHEIAHFLLHKHLIGKGLTDDRFYRSTQSGKYCNTQIGPRQETEANKVAASILMPTDELRKRRKAAKARGEEIDHSALGLEFQVSPVAMKIRLDHLRPLP